MEFVASRPEGLPAQEQLMPTEIWFLIVAYVEVTFPNMGKPRRDR